MHPHQKKKKGRKKRKKSPELRARKSFMALLVAFLSSFILEIQQVSIRKHSLMPNESFTNAVKSTMPKDETGTQHYFESIFITVQFPFNKICKAEISRGGYK